MKDIEFITRIQVNGEKRELTKEEASELILRRVKENNISVLFWDSTRSTS